VVIKNCEWVAMTSSGCREVTLEVYLPQVIGGWVFEAVPLMRVVLWSEWTLKRVMPSQDVGDGIRVRYVQGRVSR